MDRPQTTIAILTPPGRGAVATVTIQGPQAVDLVQQCFSAASGRRLVDVPLRRIVFGRWHSADGSGEELVVCRLEVDRIEIHCHGGTAAVEAIVASLESAGAIRQPAEDWIAAAEPDLIAAEARLALAEARTERTALVLLDQYRGALRREVQAIIDCLEWGEHPLAVHRLARLAQLGNVGRHLTTPWRIAIVGPPNVGKSSLMNALVGYSRSIVFDQPGTTRDLVRAETAFDGWPVELIDTAGLRNAEDAIESAGVERAEQVISQVDLCLRLTDSADLSTGMRGGAASAEPPRPEIAVLNKIDLRTDRDAFRWQGVQISAKTGEGLPDLVQAITKELLGVAPSPGEAVPFTPRQIALIGEAHHAAQENDLEKAASCLRRVLA